MNKTQFLANSYVQGFLVWAAHQLPELKVHLNISLRGTGRSGGRIGPGVSGEFTGIENLTEAYHWRAAWTHPRHGLIESNDWHSTQISIKRLGSDLKAELLGNSPDDKFCLSVCSAIVAWGGDRNDMVGAIPFLRTQRKGLPSYLSKVKNTLSLTTADTDGLDGICEMNAMLTKVHALASDDGLPIYDSRVAGAVGSLVELYRQSLAIPWGEIPSPLRFKATDYALRRRARGLRPMRIEVLDPGVITRGSSLPDRSRRAREWSSCKVRLGWLIQGVLVKAEVLGLPLYSCEKSTVDKMHAFEAALFMMGFNVDSMAHSAKPGRLN